MPLNDLNLEELTELAGTLQQLQEVGQQLAAYGLSPEFDLTPGQDMKILLAAEMPAAPGRATEEDVARIEAKLDQRLANIAGDGAVWIRNPTPSPEAARQDAQPEPAPELEPAPAQAGGPPPRWAWRDARRPSEPAPAQAGGPPPAPDQTSTGPAEGDPNPSAAESSAAGVPEPIPPAASIPQDDPLPVVSEAEGSDGGASNGSGSRPPVATHQEKFLPASWTEEEDHRLVALVVSGIVGLGLTKTAAINAAARELGRPEAGTAFRAHHKLKDRLVKAVAEAVAAKVEAEALLTDQDQAGDAAVGGHSPAAVQDEPDLDTKSRLAAIAHGNHPTASPITAHIMTLPDKGGWTLERDLELMDLSIQGWQPNEIALELKIQASQVRPRFDLLTGLVEDEATGKKTRRFKREDVLEALRSITPVKPV